MKNYYVGHIYTARGFRIFERSLSSKYIPVPLASQHGYTIVFSSRLFLVYIAVSCIYILYSDGPGAFGEIDMKLHVLQKCNLRECIAKEYGLNQLRETFERSNAHALRLPLLPLSLTPHLSPSLSTSPLFSPSLSPTPMFLYRTCIAITYREWGMNYPAQIFSFENERFEQANVTFHKAPQYVSPDII